MKRDIDKSSGDNNIPLLIVDRTARQRIRKEIEGSKLRPNRCQQSSSLSKSRIYILVMYTQNVLQNKLHVWVYNKSQ